MTTLRTWLAGRFGRDSPDPAPASSAPPRSAPPEPSGSREVAWCHLQMVDGGWLTLRDGAVVGQARLDLADALVALRPLAMPGLLMLVSPDTRPFAIAPDGQGTAVSARAQQTDTAGIVRVKYPLGSPFFLQASPGLALRFDGAGNSIDCAFRLAPAAEGDISAWLRGIAGEVGAAAADGLRAERLLAALRTRAIRPDLAAALARVMPADELEALARLLITQPAALAVLRRAIPNDPWLAHHLPALAAWVADGRPAAPDHRVASPASEEPALLPLVPGRSLMPAGLALQGLARRQILPRRLACVVATARNEGAYLLDWAAYHLSIGFDHIFVYTNDNTDGSDPLLAALARHGVITWVDNARGPQTGPQDKAYAHALSVLPQVLDYRWTAILDLDEYLGFDATLFGRLPDLLALHDSQPVDAVALCWLMFAAGLGETWSDLSSLARFSRRETEVNPHVKSLFRTRLFWHAQPHFPYATLDAPFTFRAEDGHLHHHPGVTDRLPAFSANPSARQAWVNHYFLRTAEEALWKFSRGRANWLADETAPQRLEFLELVGTTFSALGRPEQLVEDRRIQACAKDHEATRRRLLALPGVAEADRAAKAAFTGLLAETRAAFLAAPLPEGVSDDVRRFRDLLAHTQA